MKFNDWMRSAGLSESSVLKYCGAIEGALSDWAREANIIDGSILDISSSIKFDTLAPQIRKLPIFIERNTTGHNMYGSALNKYSEYLDKGAIASIEEDIEHIVSDKEIETTDKAQLINSRIGQGQYRKRLLQYWKCCSVTGYTDSSILLASHIKPWSRSSNAERLDKFNGLLLVPNLDKAFDQGLISFDPSGKILISPSLQTPEILCIKDNMSVTLSKEHEPYMAYHRKNVFITG